jgi:hypothetical protein
VYIGTCARAGILVMMDETGLANWQEYSDVFLKQISIKVSLTALAKAHVLGILCDFSAFLAFSIISKMKFYLFVHLMHVFVSIRCLFAICSVVTWNRQSYARQ